MSDDERDDGHRCGPCGRHLESGWWLCTICSAHLADDLLELADRFHRLTAEPSMQPGRYDRSGTSKPGSRPPLRLDVVALRDPRSGAGEARMWRGRDGKVHAENAADTPSVLRELATWAAALAQHIGHTLPAADVDDVVTWLSRRDDYIARWYDAPGLVRAVRQLRNRLRAETGDPNEKPIGECFEQVTDADGTIRDCGAAVFPPDPTARGAAYCVGRPRHEYDGPRLVRLRIEQVRREREAAEEAAS